MSNRDMHRARRVGPVAILAIIPLIVFLSLRTRSLQAQVRSSVRSNECRVEVMQSGVRTQVANSASVSYRVGAETPHRVTVEVTPSPAPAGRRPAGARPPVVTIDVESPRPAPRAESTPVPRPEATPVPRPPTVSMEVDASPTRPPPLADVEVSTPSPSRRVEVDRPRPPRVAVEVEKPSPSPARVSIEVGEAPPPKRPSPSPARVVIEIEKPSPPPERPRPPVVAVERPRPSPPRVVVEVDRPIPTPPAPVAETPGPLPRRAPAVSIEVVPAPTSTRPPPKASTQPVEVRKSGVVERAGTILYTIQVENHGAVPISQVEIQDVLPEGLDFVEGVQPPAGYQCSRQDGRTTVTLRVDEIGALGSVIIAFRTRWVP